MACGWERGVGDTRTLFVGGRREIGGHLSFGRGERVEAKGAVVKQAA